jgi:hypothetical protein
MKVRFNYSKGESNSHGTQRKGEPWNKETVRGWKVVFIDMRKANSFSKEICRSPIYWRFILYQPSGVCHYLDVALVRSMKRVASIA